MKTADKWTVKRVEKMLRKAAQIASTIELKDDRGGYIDSQLTEIADNLSNTYLET